MDAVDRFVAELDQELITAYQFDKEEIRTIKRIALETENVLDKKQTQLANLYLEAKKLTQELESLEKHSADVKSVLDALRVEEVKTKNSTRLTKKATKKAERVYEMDTQLTKKDKDVLLKRRLSLYIIKKFLGIHIEQTSETDLHVVSWKDGSTIDCTTVKSPEKGEGLDTIFWESISQKSANYDKWVQLFRGD